MARRRLDSSYLGVRFSTAGQRSEFHLKITQRRQQRKKRVCPGQLNAGDLSATSISCNVPVLNSVLLMTRPFCDQELGMRGQRTKEHRRSSGRCRIRWLFPCKISEKMDSFYLQTVGTSGAWRRWLFSSMQPSASSFCCLFHVSLVFLSFL